MIRLIKIALILTMSLMFFVRKSNATILSENFLKEEIKSEIENNLKLNGIEKYEVEVLRIPYYEIEVPEGNIEIKTVNKNTDYGIVGITKINVLVNNQVVKTFGANVKTKIYKNVWVLTDRIKKDNVLSWSNVSLEEKELNIFNKDALGKNFKPVGYMTNRNLKSGDVLAKKHLKRIPVIVKNSPVSIIFQTSTIKVVLPGMALEEGNMGDFIKVKNERYKRKFVGKIVGNNIIKVNI